MDSNFLSAGFLSALFAIVLIDLVLAGDNALIIGLVARNLPKNTQRKVIFWGTFGAIAVRAVDGRSSSSTSSTCRASCWPAASPWCGSRASCSRPRSMPPSQPRRPKAPATTFAGALRTIVIADAVMGVDNVLAIGGAAYRQRRC